jgi:hypothetical protein
MQIPEEWYVHIIPGIIILLSLTFLLHSETRKKLSDLLAKQSVTSTLAIAISAYLIGFFENAVILFGIRPVIKQFVTLGGPPAHSMTDWATFHQRAPLHIVDAVASGYQAMVFNRSLLGAILIFLVCVSISLRFSSFRKIKVAVIILTLLVSICMYFQWWDVRMTHMLFTAEVFHQINAK